MRQQALSNDRAVLPITHHVLGRFSNSVTVGLRYNGAHHRDVDVARAEENLLPLFRYIKVVQT